MTGYDYPILKLLWALFILSLYGLGLTGLVLYVIAIIRWQMNSWKYLLLAIGVVVPFAGAVAGWVALFAGGVKRPDGITGVPTTVAALTPGRDKAPAPGRGAGALCLTAQWKAPTVREPSPGF